MALTFTVADQAWQLEAIHRLNYRTFVEEIPQHPVSPDRRLVDRFHHENTYLICLDGRRLVGMVALRARRPFSLDLKLPELDGYLPPARSLVEVRLLSIEPGYLGRRVLAGLLRLVLEQVRAAGHDLGVFSATTRQLALYNHLGGVPFGPLVGPPEARFQPMYLPVPALEAALARLLPVRPEPASFLPGPVTVDPAVQAALAAAPPSHRSAAFDTLLDQVRLRLSRLVEAPRVQVLVGSGTLANDLIAGQLALLERRGLVVANGEFGERLLDHARRFGLSFDALCQPWGTVLADRELAAAAARVAPGGWLWAVHCETSTGVLNDLPQLKQLAASAGLRLCLDAVSSIGTVPVDLRGVWLASGVSGKGLAACPGLAMVFHHHQVQPAPSGLPRYLDLGLYDQAHGVPFTHSASLVAALDAALAGLDAPARFAAIAAAGASAREQLERQGWRVLAPPQHASPAVLTLPLEGDSSSRLGRRLERAGLLVSYRSEYLLRRNWLQICLMGAEPGRGIERLLAELGRAAAPRETVTA
ncbi:MAG: aminotransferase class V-fold PLP-dependent enzyme [Armatimonadetes bacterium]|nr:aminotransferase class V-fold PLP-dependent enzyme [Armatimonadota bacterium]